MKILIVEPDATRQRQLRTILASLGHKSGDTETAPDAKSAINVLRKKRFDCAFLAMSPSLDALALLRELRSGSGSKSLPAVVYSSEVTKENVIAAAEAGATTFLAYPFSVSDVENVIQRAIQKSS
jgi:two-component system chemotaxis response regulator CheY